MNFRKYVCCRESIIRIFISFLFVAPFLFSHRSARAEYMEKVPPDLVNLTGSGKASTAGKIYNGEGPATAFDGKTEATRVIWDQKVNVDLEYEFPRPTRVNAIRIWRNSQHERQPKSFRFEGLGDDGKWKELESDVDIDKETDWKPVKYRYYQFTNPDHFTLYRLFIVENGGNQYTEFNELEMFCVDDGTPSIASHSISLSSATSCDVSVTMGKYDAEEVVVNVVDSSGAVAKSSELEPLASGGVATASISDLKEETTYLLRIDSSSGSHADHAPVGTFYTGALSLSGAVDGQEAGRVPGSVTVSRKAADPFPLTVNYSFVSENGAEGIDYEIPAGTIVIPAGSASAVIYVKPINNMQKEDDVIVTVTLAPGNYLLAGSESADVTIENAVLPADKNVWIAAAAGLASVGSNWSLGRAPTESDDILFDGRFSSANCEWDAAATATVASWTQTNGYTGTVTIKTVYPGKGDFQCLTVTGEMAVMSGTITHPQSRTVGEKHPATWDWVGDLLANETYRLRLAVGSLTVGADGLLDAKGKGYRVTHNNTKVNASHGGRASQSSQCCYGDPKEPIHIGLADKTQDNGVYYNGKGGGAIYVTSVGPVVVDGTIRADSDREGTGCCGAAGSVYLNASSVSGMGTISAYGPGSGDGNYKGTGGRVAIVTDEPVNRATFSAITADSDRKSKARYGGAGTVFFKDRTRPNGLLVVGSSTDAPSFNWDQIYATASVTTDGDWTFDAVEFGSFGFLVIPVGTTLTLPNGLASCTGVVASASTVGGIRYEGGTLDIGSGPQAIAGNWMFCAWSNYVFQADVTVKNGGMIGVHPVEAVKDGDSNVDVSQRMLPDFLSCRVTVNGNLTVDETGQLMAETCGFVKKNHNSPSEYLGVLGYGTHGGRHQAKGKGEDYLCPTNFYYKGYDSVFAPSLPGCSGWFGNGSSSAGGALMITVSGHLTLDGTASACGSPATGRADQNNAGGPGGSIDITAGSISGSGLIKANGGSISSTQGGGGRIAVKLTSAGADFTLFDKTSIVASGRSYNGNSTSIKGTSSAGTVYLQTAADGEKGGTIIIAMSEGNRVAGNPNTTEMVSLGYGGDAIADYKKVKYVVRDYGRAAVNADMKAASIEIADSNSCLDLEGHTLIVKSAKVNGVKLAPGRYVAGDAAVAGFVVDSATDGELIVSGSGLSIIVR